MYILFAMVKEELKEKSSVHIFYMKIPLSSTISHNVIIGKIRLWKYVCVDRCIALISLLLPIKQTGFIKIA
jgi:hypothetical protein